MWGEEYDGVSGEVCWDVGGGKERCGERCGRVGKNVWVWGR